MSILSSKEQQTERLNICNQCKHNLYGVCTVCKCVIKLKVKLNDTFCPIGKWADVDKKFEELINNGK